MRFHYYHKDTGIVHGKHVTCPDMEPAAMQRFAERNAPGDHLPISGDFDLRVEKINISTCQAEHYAPPAPSADHEWSPEARRWLRSAAAVAADQRRLTARERLTYLNTELQPALMRRVMLDNDAVAREQLRLVDEEIARLRESL